MSEQNLQEILQGIGQTGDMVHMARDSLRSLIRLLSFLKTGFTTRLTPVQAALFQTVEQDVRALGEDAQFAAQESAFLLDATLGQINIEQNNIIKIFTIVGVVFAPPTLLASIWGMNFKYIPELDLHYGYYMALGCLLISAALPLAYFKLKKWI